ncbi:hypothetical protein [Nonomuraea sp. NEAU-A123]|uniref:hypothetical protein n=1 Tax=Nonomuraea sp. NEAU-A123 TaxID=2839649 RepID=UPI001BE4BEEB|nr:hypothetical protein [Nonomuraea sp. NEAU-A123]MBT2226006.1 hypothetical protein [Nonomuraea sp. NEAU-A123]
MSIVRFTTLAAALAFGAALTTGVSAHADARPVVKQALSETTQRIASGSTAPGMGWQLYENNVPGLYIDVDTTSAGFTGTPVYTVSVGGTDHHFELTGTSTVYRPTATGFRVYIRWSESTLPPLTVADAETNGWYVNWIGVDNP